MSEPTVDEQGRPEPPLAAGETQTLLGFLDFLRATVRWKTQDLSTEQLRRSLPGHPSGMTLGGLLKHLSYVEDNWFTEVVGGAASMPPPWDTVDWQADVDWDWHSAQEDEADTLRSLWEASVARSREVVAVAAAAPVTEGTDAGSPDPLAVTHPAWGGRASVSLRWVLTHMVEEYARHSGHADLLREALDGSTGE